MFYSELEAVCLIIYFDECYVIPFPSYYSKINCGPFLAPFESKRTGNVSAVFFI